MNAIFFIKESIQSYSPVNTKGGLFITVQNARILAHELALEYVKNLHILSDPALDNIPDMIEKFADINKRFYETVTPNSTLSGLY